MTKDRYMYYHYQTSMLLEEREDFHPPLISKLKVTDKLLIVKIYQGAKISTKMRKIRIST